MKCAPASPCLHSIPVFFSQSTRRARDRAVEKLSEGRRDTTRPGVSFLSFSSVSRARRRQQDARDAAGSGGSSSSCVWTRRDVSRSASAARTRLGRRPSRRRGCSWRAAQNSTAAAAVRPGAAAPRRRATSHRPTRQRRPDWREEGSISCSRCLSSSRRGPNGALSSFTPTHFNLAVHIPSRRSHLSLSLSTERRRVSSSTRSRERVSAPHRASTARCLSRSKHGRDGVPLKESEFLFPVSVSLSLNHGLGQNASVLRYVYRSRSNGIGKEKNRREAKRNRETEHHTRETHDAVSN